jgi:flagellar P-ring protein precursor FlgI
MRTTPLITLTLLAALASNASAVKIADITHIYGQRTNVLTGIGLVVGLKGTGDGGDFLPAIRPLAQMLGNFGDTSSIKELSSAANVAIVNLEATIPESGARQGDHLDLRVMSIGAASSLKSGRLFVAPMTGPVRSDKSIYAMAEGAIDIEDPSSPTAAVVKGGCVLERDWVTPTMDTKGRFDLVLEGPSAGWSNASLIAKVINDSADTQGQELAVAIDQKTVVVTIPVPERPRPDGFISRVLQLPITIRPTEARVQINERTGTLVMTGDVEISPVVISHNGLTISTVNPAPVPSPRNPVTIVKDVISVDTTNEGGGKLQDLVNALDAIKVPTTDRIEIIKELYKTGKLHAKLIVE